MYCSPSHIYVNQWSNKHDSYNTIQDTQELAEQNRAENRA